jgi:DNA-binding transcriptional LysR family regulator
MEIRQLQTFKAVADCRSFHKAANAIHYAQSTVSAQIIALEKELEVAQLMVWHHDKWLTPVLKVFMDMTREIFKTV